MVLEEKSLELRSANVTLRSYSTGPRPPGVSLGHHSLTLSSGMLKSTWARASRGLSNNKIQFSIKTVGNISLISLSPIIYTVQFL